MKKCIFLDRDGVVCKEKSYIKSIGELEIFNFAQEAVAMLKSMGFLVIVVTNQSAVARGLLREEELVKIHEYMKKELGVDAIYYCPHLPPIEGQEEKSPYGIHCNCRKPQIGMIEQALKDFHLEPHWPSFFVGDRASDILTGQNIGAKTVLLESGYGKQRLEAAVEADYYFDDLLAFAKWLSLDS